MNDQSTRRKRPIDGNINVDIDPKGKRKSEKSKFNDGEYVDYEEVD